MSGFCAKKISSNKKLYLVNGIEDDGRTAWYYLEVDALKEAIFKRKCTIDSSFDIRDFGTVVASGWGSSPPDDIRQKMEDKK